MKRPKSPITNRQLPIFLLLFLLPACGRKQAETPGAPQPVEISRDLFYSADSLALYARLAYLNDDPKALFVTGLAAHLKHDDPSFPDSLSTVPLDEADIMLLRAAEKGNADAITYIKCCEFHGTWSHFVPDNCK